MTTLYTPTDVAAANDAWGANCGPGSLAAILGKPVMEVQQLVQLFKGYMTPTAILLALRCAGVRVVVKHRIAVDLVWPQHGLAFIQWDGPWCAEGVPARAAYRHTHWVASVDGNVYEVNGLTEPDIIGQWMSRSTWEEQVPAYLTERVKRATGRWWIRCAIEVERRAGLSVGQPASLLHR